MAINGLVRGGCFNGQLYDGLVRVTSLKWHLLSGQKLLALLAPWANCSSERAAAFTKLETQQTAGIHPYESSYKKRSQTVSLASP